VWAAFKRGNDGSPAWLADYRSRFTQHADAATLHHITPGPGATLLGLA